MKPSFFPSRLFRWFVTQQILFAGILFVLVAVAIDLWFEHTGLSADEIELIRYVVIAFLAACFVTLVSVSFLMARRLVIPLGRLIEKTRRLRDFPFEIEDTEPEAITFDEPGEWFELERAINRLGRELQQKTIRLSREKTELRAIMSAVSEAVMAVSKEKRVLFYNPQFAYLFNLQGSKTDLHVSELLRSVEVLDTYDESLRLGQPVRREVQVIMSQERLPRDFQLSVAPLRKKHNQEIYGVAGIFHDITELKQTDRIRIEFVGNVSHELRTPLTAINGYLQTLTSDFAQGRLDQASDFLKIVSSNVTRLKSLVEDLLDLSALESGKELNIEDISVREVTESVLSQVPVGQHKVHIAYDFEEMRADSKRMEQVLRNLMENAVRYVPEGGNIEIRWRKPTAKQLQLVVKDDGPGIAPEHQARLFERFYRVDESRARSAGGTGIGLSLVKHIVQRHGGHVTVISQVGRGSEFVCEFPV